MGFGVSGLSRPGSSRTDTHCGWPPGRVPLRARGSWNNCCIQSEYILQTVKYSTKVNCAPGKAKGDVYFVALKLSPPATELPC